jgi:hypothetical protein
VRVGDVVVDAVTGDDEETKVKLEKAGERVSFCAI